MYAEAHKAKNAKKLPKNLETALSHLSKSKVMNKAFSKDTINSYVKLRSLDIKDFKKSKASKKKGITKWEKLNTLDC